MRKRRDRRTTQGRVAGLGLGSEAWLQAAFAPPTAPSQLARRIMEQLDIRLDAEKPVLTLERLGLAASPAGITRVFLRRGEKAPSPVRDAGRIGKLLDQARKELAEYLAGERAFFSVPVDLSQVPPFERSALEVAARIPYGEVRSYKWIAERLGNPDAARAVGSAMASNPVPIIIPCHRVVRTDGSLG
ncbi:MAG: methylated-DNA--[protein]-cysteine S-methyltransferase, partial [candidate division NC10 bacterium]